MYIEFNKVIDKLPSFTKKVLSTEYKVIFSSLFIALFVALVLFTVFDFVPKEIEHAAGTFSETYHWTRSSGSTAGDYGARAVTDSNGNIYYTGAYVFTVDFDGTAGTDNHSSINNSRDNFISKYDSSGNYQWTRTFGGNTYDDSHDLGVDSLGNVYLTGQFGSTNVDFDDTAGTDLHSSIGSSDVFITKYNSDGTYGWTRTIGGSGGDSGYAIQIDQVNNVLYVAGAFQGTNVDFDSTAGTDLRSANGYNDFFISKYDLNGNYYWSRTSGAINSDVIYGLDIENSGNIYAVGQFNDTVDFDATAGTDLHSSIGNEDIFITSYDSSGNYLYTNTWGGTGSDGARDLYIDDSAASPKPIYIVGSFRSVSMDFDPTGATDNHSSLGWDDVFLTKQLTNGNYSWTRTWGGNSFDFADSVAIDSLGNPYVTASMSYPSYDIDYDATAGIDLITGVGYYDAALSSYDSSGGYRWTRLFGSTHIDHVKVHIDNNDNIVTTGWFWYTVDFDHTAATDNKTSAGDRDMFISKYNVLEIGPTNTPIPSNTPVPNTPIPTNTPTSAPMPSPTNTPGPTTPSPSSTPKPTNTPGQTPAVIPSATTAPTIPASGSDDFQILNLDFSLDAEDVEGNNIEFGSENGLVGENNVIVRNTVDSKIIAEVKKVYFDKDLDWYNLFSGIETTIKEEKILFHFDGSLEGFDQTYILYLDRNLDHNVVKYCPGAEKLSDVKLDCNNGLILTPNERQDGKLAVPGEIEGNLVWEVSGLTGTGLISYFDEDFGLAPTATPSLTGTPNTTANTPTPNVNVTELPDTGDDNTIGDDIGGFIRKISEGNITSTIINLPGNLFEAVSSAITRLNIDSTLVLALVPITGISAASFISYPRFLLYGFAWIKGRKKTKSWGIVFDSETKEPLPFVVLKIYQDGVYIREQITDLQGKFGFAVNPGKYQVLVEHSGYEKLSTDTELTEEGFIALDIPLIKVGESASKLTSVKSFIRLLKQNLGKINTTLVVSGFIFSIVATVLSPVLLNFLIVSFYLAQFIILIYFAISKRRNWGYVFDTSTKQRIQGAFVRVFSVDEKRQLDVQMTDNQGRYGFRLNPGQYLMKVDSSNHAFPSTQHKASSIVRTGNTNFVSFTIQQGKPVNLSVGLDPI